jgi:hypothetical protein
MGIKNKNILTSAAFDPLTPSNSTLLEDKALVKYI